MIIGGARSGKSNFAQELASKSGGSVLFVATAEAGDEEMRQRIQNHKKNRPPSWTTLEVTTNVGSHIIKHGGEAEIIIVDCITLLVSNVLSMFDYQVEEQTDDSPIEKQITHEINQLIECINRLNASFIIVTNEVGMDLVPANQTGRHYRDLLGRANQLLAQHADRVYLMVAGIPVPIKPA